MNINEYFNLRGRFEHWHTHRHMTSLKWIDQYATFDAHILNLGGDDVFSGALKKFYSADIETNVIPDLRYKFQFKDNHFDLVLCMETFEHICDRGDSRIDIFTGSGIKNIISETFRVLKSGGRLFLTTPNVCCYNSVYKILCGGHPFSYEPHFREFTADDTKKYIESAGFKIERIETLRVWQDHKISNNIIEKIDEISKSLNCDVDRGDCIFIMARKD